MAVLVTNPQLKLEGGEKTAFEMVASTIDYVCDKMRNCDNCPFNWLCSKDTEGHNDGYDIAEGLRTMVREG